MVFIRNLWENMVIIYFNDIQKSTFLFLYSIYFGV